MSRQDRPDFWQMLRAWQLAVAMISVLVATISGILSLLPATVQLWPQIPIEYLTIPAGVLSGGAGLGAGVYVGGRVYTRRMRQRELADKAALEKEEEFLRAMASDIEGLLEERG